jgi:methionyl-tRNA synthetase
MGQNHKTEMNERFIVTDALPYANGPLHIGHFGGVHLPADIYTRFLKKKGKDVIHICGTDENGVPITIAAEKQGISPQEIVDHYHNLMEITFKNLGVEFDNFSGTSRKVHHELAQDFFLILYEKGYVEPITTKEFYCPKCERFLPDRYVEGTCPYCGYEKARGDSCESCGSWLESEQLKNPRCKLCGSTPEKKGTKHWYLSLNKFQKELEEWIEKKNWKKTVKRYLKGWLDEGLRPRPITRDLKWGVKVPLEEAKDKVLYVWFEAPLGYISSTIEWAERIGEPDKWKEYWQGENTKLIHFLGKDNIVFHGIIWPATLMGYGEYILPSEIPANEYVNLEGQKISTSNNWAVWLHEYIEDFDPDFLRYYLTLICPETKDSDFKWNEFQERVNAELIDTLGNFVNRTLKFIEQYSNGRIPKPGAFEKEDKELLCRINELIDELEKNLSAFQFRRALKNFIEIAAAGNRYYDLMEPWVTRKKDELRTATTLHLCSHIIYILANIGELFIPFGAKKTLSMMNLEKTEWHRVKEMIIPVDHPIREVKPLYKKIEDYEIQKQVRRLRMSYISIEDFKQMGLKIGVIKEVDDIEGADKLYKLTVDTGEKRTLVAGIKKNYTPEELKEKKIVVITNLEPITIRGVRSDGMLLAATEGDIISLISPDREDLKPGSQVS